VSLSRKLSKKTFGKVATPQGAGPASSQFSMAGQPRDNPGAAFFAHASRAGTGEAMSEEIREKAAKVLFLIALMHGCQGCTATSTRQLPSKGTIPETACRLWSQMFRVNSLKLPSGSGHSSATVIESLRRPTAFAL
jgi:hypothetical protein